MKKLLITLLVLMIFAGGYVVSYKRTRADSGSTPRAYDPSGTEIMGYHEVMGTVALVAGTKSVTLSGGAVFTSNSSYKCSLADSTGINATAITYTSGSQFTINGLLTDNVSFLCVGN